MFGFVDGDNGELAAPHLTARSSRKVAGGIFSPGVYWLRACKALGVSIGPEDEGAAQLGGVAVSCWDA